MEWSLFIELIRHTKSTLDSIKKYTQLSRGKFSDKEFGEFSYRMITKEIEKNDLLVNSFLNYIKVTTPIRKKGTVNTLIEEVLKKNQVRLEENKTKIFRNLEKDLPETIVPDEQLRFILNSILQYAMASMRSDGNIEFLTKSSALQKESSEEAVFEKDRKYIEILVAFTSYKKPMEKPMQELRTPTPKEEFVSEALLRLVDATVKMNQGVTRLEVDETKAQKSVFLKLPVERRKVVFYESTSTNQRS
jgi:hypothetical protein